MTTPGLGKLSRVSGLMAVLALYLSAPTASAQQTFSLRATNENLETYFVRHRNNKIDLATVNPNKTLEIESATFLVVPALNGNSGEFSIESFHDRGFFLRHEDYRLVLSDGSNPSHPESFNDDASFISHEGFVGGDTFTYESSNFRNHFIRHRNFELWIARDDVDGTGADEIERFHRDASFKWVSPGLAAAESGICAQWGVPPDFYLRQENGFSPRLALTQTGGNLKGNATSEIEGSVSRGEIEGSLTRGSAEGSIGADQMRLTVRWRNGTVGVYRGKISPTEANAVPKQGFVSGYTFDQTNHGPKVGWIANAFGNDAVNSDAKVLTCLIVVND